MDIPTTVTEKTTSVPKAWKIFVVIGTLRKKVCIAQTHPKRKSKMYNKGKGKKMSQNISSFENPNNPLLQGGNDLEQPKTFQIEIDRVEAYHFRYSCCFSHLRHSIFFNNDRIIVEREKKRRMLMSFRRTIFWRSFNGWCSSSRSF